MTRGDDLQLLDILPADEPYCDEWLREMSARLGVEVPAAMPPSAFEDEMQEASERASATLAEMRERCLAGLPDDQAVFALAQAGLIPGARP